MYDQIEIEELERERSRERCEIKYIYMNGDSDLNNVYAWSRVHICNIY